MEQTKTDHKVIGQIGLLVLMSTGVLALLFQIVISGIYFSLDHNSDIFIFFEERAARICADYTSSHRDPSGLPGLPSLEREDALERSKCGSAQRQFNRFSDWSGNVDWEMRNDYAFLGLLAMVAAPIWTTLFIIAVRMSQIRKAYKKRAVITLIALGILFTYLSFTIIVSYSLGFLPL